MHTLPRCGLIFPFQMPFFYTGFSVVLYLHNWSPWSLRTSCKKSRGSCPQAPGGAYAPRTLRTCVLKKWPPSQLVFAVRNPPKSRMNLHRLFNMSYINTHFDIFQKLRHIWVSYISWYVLGSMSLTCLPIFVQQQGSKHNDREKTAAF